ncbi:hypothetical protein GCM10022199_14560 [Marihabitans asiaticum]|uniref:Putative pyrroloquinoline-quinone binding quinoprotein n=1 Tax=Marihabitans asiaticum TaxID=415218 RepID=A0A560W8D8_9MICO|nr:PQQ-binding-like beta-propeller repeat protein [Marihabitans asiaticum]TWD13850.1 putative pyrroloquinoline-quinone binding quinoprotein [Marihabitans asiaticum]
MPTSRRTYWRRRLVVLVVIGLLVVAVARVAKVFLGDGEPRVPHVGSGEVIEPEELREAVSTEKSEDLPRASETSPGSWSMPMLDGAGEITWRVVGPDGQPLSADDAKATVSFPDQEQYTELDGVVAWRGGPWRTGGTFGERSLTERTMEVAWQAPLGELSALGGTWDGAGWTGQPIIVRWPDDTAREMGIEPGTVEVLQPAFDGVVHRVDLATGQPTKDGIATGQGFKGTGSLDPRGYPLLYAGQGLPSALDPEKYDMRFAVLDLIEGDVEASITKDPLSQRRWQAFDSSSLVDAEHDILVAAGENGIIYRVELNSTYDGGTVTVEPQITRLTFETPATDKVGIESSPVAYRNLVWFSDNDGNLLCVDVATMQVVWARDVGDDSDATMPLEVTDQGLYLYHGNEIDHRGAAGGSQHPAQLRKIDALTGEVLWEHEVPTEYNAGSNGGVLASPMLGRDDLAGLVLFNVSRAPDGETGRLVALDTATGEQRWVKDLEHLSWSTPTQVTGSDGASVVVLADAAGTLRMIDPATGEDLSSIELGGTVEATPAVYDDMLVVATRNRALFGIRLQ